MKKHCFTSLQELNQYVGTQLFQELNRHPSSMHLLPTGNTFIRPYQVLIELLQSSTQDFSNLVIVNLDEYLEFGYPLKRSDSRSFASYMEPVIKTLEGRGFQRKNHLFPYSAYPSSYCFTPYERLEAFDSLLSQFPCASAFLGLGPKQSPHIAFANPGYTTFFQAGWREIGAFVTPVDSATRLANRQDRGMLNETVPEWACTISPGTLVHSKPLSVYLVAYGREKDLSELNYTSDVNYHPAAVLPYLEESGSKVEVVTCVSSKSY
jgi:6-phosphogluconolactonase/glucosamine-6-phosphate isomerase/deaminase